jgi:glucose dehydrogenase
VRIVSIWGVAFGLLLQLSAQTDWPVYGHDPASQRYSPIDQINTRNVAKLKQAWQYGVDPGGVDTSAANRLLSGTEAVPIMAGGLLYTPTVRHSIVALQPETGREVWKYELPNNVAAPLRGVTYWLGDKEHSPRIMAGLSDGRLIAIDAKTGKLAPGFGKEGTLDLRVGVTEKFPGAAYHMASPGAIFKQLIVTGAQGKEDDPDGPPIFSTRSRQNFSCSASPVNTSSARMLMRATGGGFDGNGCVGHVCSPGTSD